jgi:phospholipid/cholesterol/gamma-HCH transport system permease protein
LFWLEEAGQEGLIGGILVTVLLREVTPLLVGFVVLGRSGANTAAEIGALQLGGEVERVAAQGIDPFLLLILPRAVALAVACYTLGVVFMLVAMAVGLAVADLGRGVLLSTWQFFATVLGAMQPRDFAIFPAKMLVIGLLIAVTSALSGLMVRPDEAANLLPRSFVRGVLAIMISSLTLSLAV